MQFNKNAIIKYNYNYNTTMHIFMFREASTNVVIMCEHHYFTASQSEHSLDENRILKNS